MATDTPQRTAAHWPAALAVFLAALVALVALDALVLDEVVAQGDDLIYEKMAQDPLGTPLRGLC